MLSAESIIQFVAPHVCLGCAAEGSLVCSGCAADAFPALPSRCYRCKRLTAEYAVCRSCRPSSALRRVWVSTTYEAMAKQLLWRYKFQRARAAAVPVARALHETLPFLPPATVVSFVPTATSRLRLRGYDQAELIAREFAGLRGLPCKRLVTRVSQLRQVGATRKQRQEHMQNAFLIAQPALCQKAAVLVIDDVLTTGSTLEAVAKTVRVAGATHVDGAVFAQA